MTDAFVVQYILESSITSSTVKNEAISAVTDPAWNEKVKIKTYGPIVENWLY